MVLVVDPGKMNVLFELQTLTASDDGAGGTDDPQWTTVRRFWGELMQSRGSKSFRNTEMVIAYDYAIKTYWMKELTMLNERSRVITNSGSVLYIDTIENVNEKNFVAVIGCSKEK
jgi:head-tail adaptor